MIAQGNSFIQLVLALAFVIASGYAAGRIHQWYKHGLERDFAFREGYDQASQSMFDMVTRSVSRRPAAEVPVQARPGSHINEPHTSRYTTADIASVPDLVGSSRRRIMAHPVAAPPRTRSRHAA